MTPKQGAYLKIHIAVLLFGITAILGKLIVFEEIPLVWHRLWIAVLGLVFIPGVLRGILEIPRRRLLTYVGIGVVVCLHWLSFYGSIKLANSASITLACLATSTFFTALLEPIITKSKFQWVELILGVLVIAGIYFIMQVDLSYTQAIVVGLISAFLASLFSVLNKKYIANNNTLSVSTIELGSGFIFLTLVLPFVFDWGSISTELSLFGDDLYAQETLFGLRIHSFWYLVLLGVGCTSLAYALALSSLKQLSAFTSNLAVNLEPIYGILLAAAIFQENKELTFNFYLGTALILSGVMLHPFLLNPRRFLSIFGLGRKSDAQKKSLR
jgi:drug/metabolite transporter (DMT)-like permease